MTQKTDILIETEGYYAWLKALVPGDEVIYIRNAGYWNRGNQIVKIIENTSDRIILSSGAQINPKTGRLVYCRTSYSDREIHIRPVTQSDRDQILLDETRSKFNDATSFNTHKFTVNEMEQVMKLVNKILLKRKSHVPVIEGE